MLTFAAVATAGLSLVGAATLYVSYMANQHGVITGILYVVEDSSAIVDGTIIYRGDVVFGVRVVNIEKFAVEFEKNGIRWKQKIREKPNPAWEQMIQEKAKASDADWIWGNKVVVLWGREGYNFHYVLN
jgi:hypothetical protein